VVPGAAPGIAFIESSDAEPITLERGSGHDGTLAVLRSSAARTPATVRVEPWLLRKVNAGHIRQSDASRMPIRRSRPLGLMTGVYGIRAITRARLGEHAASGFGENQLHRNIVLACHQE
jgi:hypothetical protein